MLYFSKLLAAGLVLSTGAWVLFELASARFADRGALAVQLSDGRTYFANPPRLVDTMTTFNSAYVWGATYYFTLRLPDNAGEPLQRVTIKQQDNVERIQFNLAESSAFASDPSGDRTQLTLKSIDLDAETNIVSVYFDPPVPPGKTIAIGLRPYSNPSGGGVYLFGVTAFPPGEKAQGQFLGYGRLQFYSRDRSFRGRFFR